MSPTKMNYVDRLLAELDKDALAKFIRQECVINAKLCNRFVALGAGTLFKPDPATYSERVVAIIEDYCGHHGYIKYRDTFNFNREVTRILNEADQAIEKGRWDVAVAVLTGIASVAEDIINCGDDSNGELGAIVSDCFEKWLYLSDLEKLPDSVQSEIFELAINRFKEKDLEGWDWWWDWIQMAINLAETPERQAKVFQALDAIEHTGEDWHADYVARTAQNYKLEMMSRCGGQEEQLKFMYDNVSNYHFRERLIQLAWEKEDYQEVLRLAQEGESHDAIYAGLVRDWKEWQYKVYRLIGDRDNQLQLARHFFFERDCFGHQDFCTANMYEALKSLIPQNEWQKYVHSLIEEAGESRKSDKLLFLYIKEEKWPEYMEYIRKHPETDIIDAAPQEVKDNFRDEIIALYASDVRKFFNYASTRKAYSQGVELLRNLIHLGGRKEAQKIVTEQKARTPRRPALIDELSNL